jgi:hypothetical protein
VEVWIKVKGYKGIMSFLSVFKGIGKGLLGVVTKLDDAALMAAPIVTAFNPAAGALLTMIGQAVAKAEATITSPKSGADKLKMVQSEVLPTIYWAFQIAGKPVPPDIMDKITKVTNGMVDVLNATHAIAGSVTELPPPENTVQG